MKLGPNFSKSSQYARWDTCAPIKRRDAANEKMWSASNRYKLVYVRRPMTEFGANYRAESRCTPHGDIHVRMQDEIVRLGWFGHKKFRPLGLCALALKSARTAWFQTSPRNPSGIPTKTCWLFFFSQFLSPFLSNLVVLSSSNLVPGRENKQPCAFDLKQPCACRGNKQPCAFDLKQPCALKGKLKQPCAFDLKQPCAGSEKHAFDLKPPCAL